jgi:hypothetical protein
MIALGTLLALAAVNLAAIGSENDRPEEDATSGRQRRSVASPALAATSRLATVSDIDWNAFPDACGPAFLGRRRIIVTPGRPGVLSAALATARPGDSIILRGGTYREGSEEDYRGLLIRHDGVAIRVLPGQRARIVPRSQEVTYGVVIQASNVLLQGLTIEGFSSVGIAMEKEGETLKNIVFRDLHVKMPADDEWSDGIVLYHDNRAIGRPASDGLRMHNVTVENASLGISCNAGPCRSWWLENVTVVGRGGHGSGADAIAVEDGENIVLHRVDVSKSAADGIDLKAKRVLISACRVHDVARNGLKLWYGGDIVNTIVEHTGADAAIVFEHRGRYRILNSLMAFHNYPGPRSYNLTAGYDSREQLQVELINSIFYRTSGGMFFQDGTTVKVKHCIFHDMKNGELLRAAARGEEISLDIAGGAAVFTSSGLGTGVILDAPRFVAPDRGDYRLMRSSPGIDRGIRVAKMPAVDITGAPRIRSGTPDIGPFEGR